jgi:hypothetical protein
MSLSDRPDRWVEGERKGMVVFINLAHVVMFGIDPIAEGGGFIEFSNGHRHEWGWSKETFDGLLRAVTEVKEDD